MINFNILLESLFLYKSITYLSGDIDMCFLNADIAIIKVPSKLNIGSFHLISNFNSLKLVNIKSKILFKTFS